MMLSIACELGCSDIYSLLPRYLADNVVKCIIPSFEDAIKSGLSECTKYRVNGVDKSKLNVALVDASKKGYVGVVRCLIDAGADVHFHMDKSLRVSLEEGHDGVVKCLLDAGHVRVVESLLKRAKLRKFTVKELRAMCKEKKYKGYSTYTRKDDLIGFMAQYMEITVDEYIGYWSDLDSIY